MDFYKKFEIFFLFLLGIDNIEEVISDQSTGIQNKQAIIQRPYRVDNRRYFTASIVEDNKVDKT